MNSIGKFAMVTTAVLLTSCRLQTEIKSEPTNPILSAKPTIILADPGQKLIEIQHDHAHGHVWLQSRPAAEGEEFGSLTESVYDVNTGQLIKQIIILEQPGRKRLAPAPAEPKSETNPVSPSRMITVPMSTDHCADLSPQLN